MQLILFLLMTFTFLSCAGFVLLSLLTKLTGFTPVQLTGITPASPLSLIYSAVTVQGIQSIFIFLLPSLVFAYLAHPRPAAYLGLRKPGKMIQLPLVILLMVGASPLLMFIEHLVSLIDFGKEVKAAQLANENTMTAFMTMPDVTAFLRVFIVMAIIPAVGEEMFFRGIMMRFARKRSKSMLFPVLFSAAIFAYAHSNIYGYLSIFLAGMLLAVIYNLTGSLWCSIAGHMFFNGTQVVLSYLGNISPAVKSLMAGNSVPYYLVISGAVVFTASLYLLLKNKTPLPPNWSDDFTHEELIIFKAESMK